MEVNEVNKTFVKVLLVLLPILLLITSVCGCGNTAATSPAQTTSKLFIWKVTSETTQVYLLGSVHVAKKDLYPLDNTIENAFNAAKYLVVEINSNNLSQDYASQMMMKYGVYTNGSKFKDNVSAELYNKLDKLFTDHGMSLGVLNDFKPFIMYSLMSQFMAQDLGYMSNYGIDFHYLDQASKSNKAVKELETFEFQMNLLSSIPDKSMITAMEYDIDNPNTGKDIQDVFDAWQKGDTAKLEAITFAPAANNTDFQTYFDMFVTNRNHTMVDKIVEYLADNEIYFVVVGAGHLIGKDGIPNLLENKGYKVEQLFSSN
jgi:uncharacterized protein YbaP (TraB family)